METNGHRILHWFLWLIWFFIETYKDCIRANKINANGNSYAVAKYTLCESI